MEDNIKQGIARRQLGTALALYLADEDPVSVHCLACGGGEIAEFLATSAGETPFSQHVLDIHAEMKASELGRLRNQYWNAMKHATRLNGQVRDDDELMSQFDDTHNDHALFVEWLDYAPAAGNLPIEAQVFQIWYFAIYPDKLAEEFSTEPFEEMFPGVREMNRSNQKKLLRSRIVWARKKKDVMEHTKTDRRKLILSRTAAPLPS